MGGGGGLVGLVVEGLEGFRVVGVFGAMVYRARGASWCHCVWAPDIITVLHMALG